MESKIIGVLIVLSASFLFIHSLGITPLFDWDEINFAESAREMISSNNYGQVQINFEPFWEKPPLFIWFQVISMKVFGINEFAARFPNAIAGILTLITLFCIGNNLMNYRFGVIWAMTYACSILPHLYFKSGIIDPWFNYFTFVTFYLILKHLSTRNSRSGYFYLEMAGLSLGLACLTKGPVSILLVAVSFFSLWISNPRRFEFKLREVSIFIGVTFLIIISWLGFEMFKNGTWFVKNFIDYQIRLATSEDAGHGGFLGYHFIILFFGMFPASIFIFNQKKYFWESVELGVFRRAMLILLVVVLLIFSIVKTKIIHYSSLGYFPISFLASYGITTIISDRKINSATRWLGLLIGLIFAVFFIIIVFVGRNPHWLLSLFEKDIFTYACLKADVFWPTYLIWPGIILGLCSVIYFYLSAKQKYLRVAIEIIFIGSLVSIQGVITFYVPRFQKYSQEAAVQFYQQKASENVPIGTLYFKSYGPFFYGKISPKTVVRNTDSLIKHSITKFYIVSKNNDKVRVLKEYGAYLKIDYERNGFVFYKSNQLSKK